MPKMFIDWPEVNHHSQKGTRYPSELDQSLKMMVTLNMSMYESYFTITAYPQELVNKLDKRQLLVKHLTAVFLKFNSLRMFSSCL